MRHALLLVIVLGVVFTNHAEAAKRLLAAERLRERLSLHWQDRSKQPSDPASLLSLDRNNDLVIVDTLQTAAGTTKVKYQQTFQGLEVFDHSIVLEVDQNERFTKDAFGYFAEGIEKDISLLTENKFLSETEALRIACASYDVQLEDVKPLDSKMIVFLDNNDRAHFAYKLHFRVRTKTSVSVPVYVIDAVNGEVFAQWPLMHTLNISNQPGGTLKSGKYIFGKENMANFDVKDLGNGKCVLENDNIKVYHLQSGTVVPSVAYNFTCANGVQDEVNGGYSPLADAYVAGTKYFEMHASWYNITIKKIVPVMLGVHIGNGVENAFFDGTMYFFGDGSESFHPLASCSDVVAHEISHGFTTANSGLIYNSQSGGMNEAFSDMAGETVEYYVSGRNDWKIGWQIIKESGQMRLMSNQSEDGQSIITADDYKDGLDVHYSSGVYNKAFYLLSNTAGWNIRKAFQIMVIANKMYWTPNTDFQKGAEGVVKAAADRGYNTADVEAAFKAVGVCASSSCIKVFNSGDKLIVSGEPFSEKKFKLTIPCKNTPLKITLTGGTGDADLYLKFGAAPVPFTDYDTRSWNLGNEEVISLNNTSVGKYYFTVYGYPEYTGATLQVSY